MPLLQDLLGDMNQSGEIADWFRTSQQVTEVINKLAMAVKGPLTVLNGHPETKKLLVAMNDLPNALRFVIETMFTDQDKVRVKCVY